MRQDRSRTGFTLVELLVAIALIGILAGITLRMSGFAARKSDHSRAIADMEKIRNALEEHRLATGQYLSQSTTSTNALLRGIIESYAPGSRIVDPWGRGYEYEFIGPFQYRLYSKGQSISDAADDLDSASTR